MDGSSGHESRKLVDLQYLLEFPMLSLLSCAVWKIGRNLVSSTVGKGVRVSDKRWLMAVMAP